MVNSKYGSGEYSPTPSHTLPAFTNGKPTGYMCMKCGNIQKDLDPLFDDLCLVCLKDWALKQGVSKMIPTADVIEHDKALEPTKTVEKSRSDATTVIINFKPQTVIQVETDIVTKNMPK
jgi:hypothetical protein